MEELRWAWAGMLLGWWPRDEPFHREPQPNLQDLAARALVAGLDTPALRELAGAPADDTAGARELLTQVMAELGFAAPEPDATPWQRVRRLLDPVTAANLDRWLAIVQRDVDAIHPDIGVLQLKLLPHGSAVVALPNGDHSGQGTDEIACWAADEHPALADVAHSAQDCLLDVLDLPWPLCPEHGRMLTTRRDDDRPVWVCDREGGHPLARVGAPTR